VNLKSACFLLGLFQTGSAAALGLGDVSVRSYLGQPMHAVVPLIGVTPAISADCLSVASSPGAIGPLPRTQLTIEQVGEQTLLHIRTKQSVNDPVTQFVLVSECEAHLQREYAVLLDPPMWTGSAGVGNAATSTGTQTVSEPEAAVAPVPERRRPATAKHTKQAASRVASASSRASAPKPHKTVSPPKPRLVLSGKRGGVGSPLALRLDTNLSAPGQVRSDSTPDLNELSDENTALNRRIAYLETQLLALQQRNAELDRSRAAAPVAVAPPPPTRHSPQWPLYLLAAGLLVGAGVLVAALRRRGSGRSRSVNVIEETWEQPEAGSASPRQDSEQEIFSLPVSQRMQEVAAPPRDEGTELKEDILDQAEVFMAHGHGELAIHLLQEHLRDAPNESPVPWLLLLDLLHRAGDNAGYDAASAECRRYFNVNLDGRAFFGDSENGPGLEAYPHLLEQLVQVWNTPDIKSFFDDLVFDHRGGTRVGFEPDAYRDILLLRSISQDVTPVQKAA
jgi:Tfp pilus assembly protein FimV